MLALTGKPLKGQSFVPVLHSKDKRYINKSSDDFRIIGKEKDRHAVLVLFAQWYYGILRQ